MRPGLRYPLAILVASLGLTVAALYLFETGHATEEHGLPGMVVSVVALFVASGVVVATIMPVVRRLAPRVFPS